ASGRPTNLYRCFAIRIESKVYGEILAGRIADGIGYAAHLSPAGGLARHLRADSGSVAALPLELQLKPVPLRASVPPQLEGLVQCGHGRVHQPITVKIRENHAPVQARRCELLAYALRYVCKHSRQVSDNTVRLSIGGIQTAAGHKEIQPTVVVEIHQAATPAIPGPAQSQQPRARASIIKNGVATIQEDLPRLVAQAGHDQVRPAI